MYDAFYPGQVWLDTNGNRIQAHGGSLIYLDGVYYWYGENKEKTDKAAGIWHWGVRYYASTDLYNWEDRGLLIPPVTDDPNSSLHPTSMMDRPHIIYNARTKKYVCWLKIMEKDQTQTETVLTADSFFGPYTIVREKLRPLGMSAGDFDLAVAPDGKAYYFFERVHSETIIADLTEDYTDVTGYYSTHFPHKGPPHVREATAHFIRHGKHYLLTSGTTGYFPNPSEAAMADTWHGPYTVQGDPHIGDKTKTSFHSQISSVFKVPNKKDLYIACADRWMPNAPDYDYTHYGPLYDRLFDPDVEKTPADWALLANLPQEDELKENIRSGVVQESLLDEAVLRILTMKFRLGLFENPFPAENVQAEITPADTALNRKIAQESMILLKNDGVLPLAKSVKKVAVIGWHADSVRALFGGYSALAMKENTLGVKMSMAGIQADADSPAAENAVQKTYPGSEVVMENPGVEPLARRCYPDAYSMLGALRLAAPHTEFLYAQGYPYAGNEESGHDAALQIAKDADLVICTLGGHYGWNASCTTGEGIDAMHIGLPVCQERFLEKLESLHKPVVGVHFDGHPISSDTADRVCNAILEAWAPGAQGGEAIAALLTGKANPCGKLPCTVARHEGQIPVYYNHPTNTCYSMTGGTPKNAYIDGAHTPRYCFGHGLSYTKYEYDTLRLEKDAIQADGVLKGQLHVRNAGNKAGTEIVQFYVHDVAASMVRPVKELVGFAKVNLQPGEEKTVCLSLPMSQLAFLDADMRWKVEHGKVELMVGASSEDIRGKAEFMIVGDAYPDGKNRSFVADTKIM